MHVLTTVVLLMHGSCYVVTAGLNASDAEETKSLYDAEVSSLPTETNSSFLCPTACQCSVTVQSSTGSMGRMAACDRPIEDSDVFDPDTQVVRVIGNCHRSFVSIMVSLDGLAELRELALQRCHLYTVEELMLTGDAVDWSTIFLLDLGFNLMTHLVNRAFVKMSSLQTLVLRHNRIETIDDGAFDELKSLRTLDLTGNRLSMVTREDMRWICPLISLEKLSLRDNGVHVLARSAFLCRPLHCSLQFLDLGENRIRRIEAEDFTGLCNLTRLNLDNSQLTSVPTAALIKLSASLKELDMSGNELGALLADSFHDLVALHTLHLNRMPTLKFIDRHSFVNMTLLRRVELSGNTELIYVDREAFMNTPHIANISLTGGGLEGLDSEVVETMGSLTTLDLRLNPIKCDCHTEWMRLSNVTLVSSDVWKRCDDDQDVMECRPRIVPLLDPHVTVALTDAFTLYCRALGFPPPHISWILPSSFTSNSSLTQFFAAMVMVKRASSRDRGNYTCTATNSHGSDSSTVTVDVIIPPTVILVSRLTATSATLVWKHVEHSKEYRLTYSALRPASNESLQGENSVPNTGVDVQYYMRSYTLVQLRPNTYYRFCISVIPSYDGDGDGSRPMSDFRDDGQSLWTVDCVEATTPAAPDGHVGMTDIRQYVIFGCAVTVGLILLVCGMGCRRHWAQRRDWPPEVSDSGSSGRLQFADCSVDSTETNVGSSSAWNVLTDEVYENVVATSTTSIISIFNAADLDEIRRTASLNSRSTDCTPT